MALHNAATSAVKQFMEQPGTDSRDNRIQDRGFLRLGNCTGKDG